MVEVAQNFLEESVTLGWSGGGLYVFDFRQPIGSGQEIRRSPPHRRLN
jgi:hypothetical protein